MIKTNINDIDMFKQAKEILKSKVYNFDTCHEAINILCFGQSTEPKWFQQWKRDKPLGPTWNPPEQK